ncbi:hypothetical protein [Providencia stuartii]|uniref:hypothetical protein n=1 Tax=Providencia stuartii TaxID=588 RepID=UPI00111E4E97|nr:hypothetical protein [Providencia stuartii]
MSEKILPDIQQTALEKVLIKHEALNALSYAKRIEEQARKYATESYQQAQNEAKAITQIAYQQGYRDGLKQLLTDMIESLNNSEKRYQQKRQQSQELLLQQLASLFHDPHLQEIIANYLIQKEQEDNQVTFHLPEELQKKLRRDNSHLKCRTSLDGDIALETNNKIIHFSPTIAAQYVLPNILSIPSRCQLLIEQKSAYQKMLNLFNKGNDDDNTTSD